VWFILLHCLHSQVNVLLSPKFHSIDFTAQLVLNSSFRLSQTHICHHKLFGNIIFEVFTSFRTNIFLVVVSLNHFSVITFNLAIYVQSFLYVCSIFHILVFSTFSQSPKSQLKYIILSQLLFTFELEPSKLIFKGAFHLYLLELIIAITGFSFIIKFMYLIDLFQYISFIIIHIFLFFLIFILVSNVFHFSSICSSQSISNHISILSEFGDIFLSFILYVDGNIGTYRVSQESNLLFI